MHPLPRFALVLSLGPLAACPSSGGRAALTWSRSFGGPGGDEAAAAIPTADGGYLFAGTAEAYYASREPADGDQIDGDLWLVKLLGSGDLDWQRSYGLRRLSPAGNRVDYSVVRPALGGGFWVGGTESAGELVTGDPLADGGNLVVARLDADGAPLWTRIHDSGAFAGYPFTSALDSAHEVVCDIAPAPDGGLLVACWVSARVDKPHQDRRGLEVNAPWVARLDPEGELVWGRHLTTDGDGVEHDRYFPYDAGASVEILVRETDDGGAFVAAHSDRHDQSRCTRLQSDGSVLWAIDLDVLHVHDAIPIDDGGDGGPGHDGVRDDGFLVVGMHDPFGDRDGSVRRLDPLGNVAWSWSDAGVESFDAVDQRCAPGNLACDYEPPLPTGADPAGVETSVAPGSALIVDVARQCVGFTPPDGGGGGGGGGEHTLTLVFEGEGSGRVTSDPSGIDCRATCSARFPAGTRVALTPLVDEGSFFSHWEGADEDFGIEGCALTLTSDRTVTVFFE